MNAMLKSTREGGILPPPSTKGGEKLPGWVLLSPSHDNERLPRVNFFPHCTKSSYCIKNTVFFCFLGGVINMQSLPDHPSGWAFTALRRPYATFTHTLQKEVVTHSWIKVSKLQNCFYYNITQKQPPEQVFFCYHEVMQLLHLAASFVQNESKWQDTTWCGASVFHVSVQKQRSISDLFTAAGRILQWMFSWFKAVYS